LQDWASRTVAYTYYADGRLKDATNPNGTVARYRYDNDRLVTGVGHTMGATQLADFGYVLDGLGNVTRVAEGGTGTLLTERVSVSSAGAQGNDASSFVTPISGDGRYVAFPSFASNLVAADTNGTLDIFLRDRTTSTTTRVSVGAGGAQANGFSDTPAISSDGRFVTFVSRATNLVASDSNAKQDIFLRDLQTGVTTRMSVSSSGAQAKQDCFDPTVSDTGRYVAFATTAKELVSGDNNGDSDIFVRDTQTGTTTRISVSTAGAQANGASTKPFISGDGRYVAFVSLATNLVTGDTNGVADVFVRDRQLNTTTRVSLTNAGAQANGAVSFLAISNDGRYVAFDSNATNLVTGDTNGSLDIFVRDLQASTTVRASLAGDGSQSNSHSQMPSISANGRYVTFDSSASNLVAGDTNGLDDIFVRDLQTGSTTRYSISTNGTQGDSGVNQLPSISGDGRTVAFQSESTTLVTGDTNAGSDVFVHTEPPATFTTYTYDRLSRLLTASAPEGAYSYAYDPAGNRTSKNFSGSTAYTYDRADRMLTAGAASVTVNANGNLVAKGADSYAYDQANRLTTSTVGSVTTAYLYDGDGTRFGSTVTGSPAERWVSDTSGPLATLVDDGVRKYVYGMTLAYTASGTTVEVYHGDRLGSVRLLTNGSGAVNATYRSDPWGSPVSSTGSSSQPLGYTGEPGGNGLTYLRTRYYSADLGRFLTRDQWAGVPAAAQTQNRYSYVANNPTTATDPSGRFLDTFVDAGFIVFDVASLIWGPEKDRGMNFLALSADLGFLFVPFATGGGAAVRYGWRSADHLDDAVGGIRWLDEAASAACSFTSETLVATPSGSVPISEIKVGDLVLSWDEATRQIVQERVTAVMPHSDDSIAVLTLENGVVITTPDHPFYTVEAGWLEAGLLFPGMHVVTSTGEAEVRALQVRMQTGELWDLTVEHSHTFYVGTGQWLVHNCAADDINPTLERIRDGGSFPHLRDGTTFKNLGDPLPVQPLGYYTEFVHPTPGVAGPGLQRIVTGAGGEIWFSPDHYTTFVRIR
jgi:RHS repeat-associated protein